MSPLAESEVQALRDGLSGRVVVDGDSDWDAVRVAFNLLIDQRPAAVVLAAGVDDVAHVLRFASATGLRVAPQTTAHGAGGLGDLGDSLLLSTSQMTGVTVDREARTARVAGGARWQDLVPQASEMGLAALHGSSLTVGVAGYSLGGGAGWYGRKWGLQANALTAVEIMVPDRRRLRASADEETDLFWALRGGGGNFGVVTALEFRLYEVDQVYAGAFFFPFERSSDVLHAWHEWLPGTPEELTSAARMMQFPPLELMPEPLRGNSFAVVEVAFLGSEADGAEVVAPLRGMGPAMDTFAMVPPVGLGPLNMDPPMPIPALRGDLLVHDFPASAIDELVAVAGPGSGSMLVTAELRQGGGALSRPDPSHGAISSVPGSFDLFAAGAPMDPSMGEAIVERIARVREVFAPHAAGRAFTFVEEPDFDTAAFFPAETYERLRAVKRTFDPDGLMHANHDIPPAS